INIIDTPGHVDFTVEVERSLRVLDGAILVLCGVGGVQSQSITVDRQMKRYRVPRLAFINKLDRVGADPKRIVLDIREKLKLNAVQIQVPIGLEDQHKGIVDLVKMKAYVNEGDNGETVKEMDIPADLVDECNKARAEMLDVISQYDDELMELLLEEKVPSNEIIVRAITSGVRSLRLVPVLMGSAFKNKSVQKLMDAICVYLPSPLDAEKMKAKDIRDPSIIHQLEPVDTKPLVCMAYKLTEEPFGQLTYTRIYQGTLRKGDTIINTRTGKHVRVGRLVRMHANDRDNIDVAYAGDIIAMIGVECATGDTFCNDQNFMVACESMHVADAVISMSVKGKDNEANMKVSKALNRFMREDPTFKVHTDEESSETIISGMGELHLEIYIERIKREYKAEVVVGQPQVNYRETISKEAPMEYLHKKQSGGAGQFAGVSGEIYPLPEGSETHFEFQNLVKGGNIPSEYIPSCEKGFADTMERGPLAGYHMMNVGVKLTDGRHHPVDSSDMAFRICARDALREAVRRADPMILEPMMKVEVETPSEYQGSVVGGLFSRRGVIAGSQTRGDETVITASVPLAEMFGYSTDLRSVTAGKATFTMEFEKFAPTPKNVQEQVIAAKLAKDKKR
ncbi:MAG: hypothetical protein ACD_79C01284G0002, partial [uncultured bacterium]